MKRLLLLLIPASLFFTSCLLIDLFSDLEGKNLLSADQQAFTGWSVGYGKTVSFNYMTFSDSSESGPETGTTVKRLELVNLMPNGDFENALSAAWSNENGATSDTVSNRLNYNLGNDTDRVNFNLGDAVNGLIDGLTTNAGYVIHFNIRSSTTGPSFYEFRAPAQKWTADIQSTSYVYTFPEDFKSYVDSTFEPDTVTNIFTVGTTGAGGAMAGYIDNVRVARTDIDAKISITIPVESEGRDDLASGTYRFTIYVKNDPGITPATANRMSARYISIGISSADDASVSNINHKAYDYIPEWSGWTACTVTCFIQLDRDATDALILTVSPSDNNSSYYRKNIGSILISSPVLEYSSDGTFE